MLNIYLTILGYLHLLPESKEKMDDALDGMLHKDVEYPITQFVVCVGFLLVLIIENIAVWCKPANSYQAFEQITALSRSDDSLNIHTESKVVGKSTPVSHLASNMGLVMYMHAGKFHIEE